jgi:hypothetical protein
MGCGASVQSGTAPLQVQRDPSDFNLEYIELVPVGIVEFDGTFSTVEQVLNRCVSAPASLDDNSKQPFPDAPMFTFYCARNCRVVELNNDVNDCLADIKAAYAVCADALQIDTRVGGELACSTGCSSLATSLSRSDCRSTCPSTSALRCCLLLTVDMCIWACMVLVQCQTMTGCSCRSVTRMAPPQHPRRSSSS